MVVNSKEHFQKFKSENINKKHKDLRKSVKGIEFGNYSKRINLIKKIENFGQLTQEKHKQNRFSIKKKLKWFLKKLKNQNLHK